MGSDPSSAPMPVVGYQGSFTPEDVAAIRATVQQRIERDHRIKDLEVAIRVLEADIKNLDALKSMGPDMSALRIDLKLYLVYLMRERDSLKAQAAAASAS